MCRGHGARLEVVVRITEGTTFSYGSLALFLKILIQ